MDFFQHQDRARKNTKLLLVYFVMAVASMVILIYAAVMVGFQASSAKRHHSYSEYQPEKAVVWWNAKVFLAVVSGTLAVIFIGSAWKTSQLAGGGGTVATLMGGTLVTQGAADPDQRKLLNVVEEMAIASSVPMPEVYVLEHEEGINAFAAGFSTSDAAIGVTRGCIRLLSREELQGVIGHEFSHILNGDMKLNIRLMGTIFGIICLASIGRILLYSRSSNSRDKNPLPILGLVLIVIGGLGVFFGRLIQAAVSRQREFLADSSAVQFTRNPGGLSGALQKIGRYSYGSKLENENAPDMCHMFFSNGLSSAMFGAMATHPPIPDRIRAIDPTWDGTFPPLKPEQVETVKHAALSELEQQRSWMANVGAGLVAAQASAERRSDAPFLEPIQTSQLRKPAPPVIQSQSIISNVGSLTDMQLRYAEQLRDQLPETLRAAARDPQSACALVYALVLNANEELRGRQLTEIGQRHAAQVAEQTCQLFTEVASVAQRARLPLVNLAIGSLRGLTAEQFQKFSATLAWLVASDGQTSLFEFVLQKIVLRHLAVKFTPAPRVSVQYYTLKPLVPDCALILSALAYVGAADVVQVQNAFSVGAPFLRAPVDVPLGLLSLTECGIAPLDAALNRLALAAPIIKKNLLEAAARVVAADGVIQETEAELLRAVADTLDCPLPPLLAGE
jgi:Zn-dependent protease with chaperone function/uncharacterized tellurite resistance protein B-like protein